MKNDDCIFHLLNKAARFAGKHWHSRVKDLQLTATQAKVLTFMLDLSNPTSQQLAEHCALDNATLTGVIDRLLNLQLVERKSSDSDRRVLHINYSEQGREIAEQLKSRQQPANEEFLTALTNAEQQQLRQLLQKL